MSDTVLLGLRVVLSLAAVLGLLWFLARRFGDTSGGTRRVISVVSRQNLTRRAGVAMIEVEGRTLLLGVSDAGVTLVSDLTDPVAAHGSADGQLRPEGSPASPGLQQAPGDGDPENPSAQIVAFQPAPSWEQVLDEANAAAASTPPPSKPSLLRAMTGQRHSRTTTDHGNTTVPDGSVSGGSVSDGSVSDGSVSDSSVLAGSVLAPGTWRRTWRVLQGRAVP